MQRVVTIGCAPSAKISSVTAASDVYKVQGLKWFHLPISLGFISFIGSIRQPGSASIGFVGLGIIVEQFNKNRLLGLDAKQSR